MNVPNFAKKIQYSDSFAPLPVLLLSVAGSQPNPLEFIEKYDQALGTAFRLMIFQEQVEELRQVEQVRSDQELKEQVRHLEMLNQTQVDKIQELESLQNPYSVDGDPICNSD